MSNLVIEPNTKEYLRYQNNLCLKSKIGKLYNQSNVILTNSGLHANYITINTIINKYEKINIIYVNDLYHETLQLLDNYKHIKKYKINNNILDPDIKSLNETNILFIESCSNPNGNIFNFNLIKELREISLKLYVICDNTWLSSIIFNPFDYDVDIVTISLSKYYSGGNSICGACLFKNNEDYLITDKIIKISGIHINQTYINIINKEIDYLEERIKKNSNLTYEVLKYLSLYSNIIVNHPLINSNYLNCFNNNLIPSTMTIGFKISDDKLLQVVNKLTKINVETSFGSKISKIDPFIYKLNDYSFVRLSLGYNDTFEIVKCGIDELIELIDLIIN